MADRNALKEYIDKKITILVVQNNYPLFMTGILEEVNDKEVILKRVSCSTEFPPSGSIKENAVDYTAHIPLKRVGPYFI